MTRLRKRRAALAALALFLAALSALALGLFPQEPLRALAERRLRDALGPGAHVGSLRVFPAGLRAEILDLTIDAPAFRARVPKARVALSPETLLGGVLSFRSLYLEYPVLSFGATGNTEPSGPFARPVVVRSLGIVGGTVEYRDPRGAGVRLAKLNVRGGIGEGILEAAAGVVLLGTGRVDQPIPFVARFRVSPLLDLDVDNFEAVTPMSRLHASGPLGRVGALRPDVRLDARLDLEELSARFGTAPARGILTGKGRCTGTEKSLSIDIALSGDRLELAGWPLERGTARLSHVTGEESRTTAAMRLDLLGGRLEGEARLRASVADGRLKISALDLERLSRAARLSGPALHGALSGELGFHGDTTADVSVQARFSAAHTQPGLGLRAEAEASGRVRVPDRSLDLDWTTRLEGDGAPGDGSVLRFASMRVVAHGKARGPLPPDVDGALEGAVGLDSPTGPFAVPVSGSLRFDGQRTSASIEAKRGQGTLTISADWRGAVAERLQVRAEGLDLSRAARDAQGRASLAFDASGPLEALTGRGKVVIEDLAWQELTVGTVTAEIDSRNGQAAVALDVPALRVTGHGRLRTARNAVLRSTIAFAGTPLEPLAPLLPNGRPLAGVLTATVEATIPLMHPAAADARARVDALELVSGTLSVRSSAPFTVAYGGEDVSVDGLRLEGSGLSLALSGRTSLRPNASFDAQLQVTVHLSDVPAPAGWTLGGTVDVDASLSGTLARPRAEGEIAAHALSAEGPALPRVSIADGTVQLDGDAAVLSGITAAVAGGSLTAKGRVPLAAVLPEGSVGVSGAEALIDVSWQSIDAAVLLERLRPGHPAPVTASLAGEMHLEGRLDSLRRLRGTLSLPETRLDVQDVALTISPATVRLANGRIETEGITLATPGGSFGAFGSVDLIGRGLDVAGKGVLELRTFSPFLAEASMTGTADLDVEVKGSLDDPRPQGTVRLHDGTLRLRAMPQALTAIGGTVVLGGQSLRIEQASANLGGGAVTLSGGGSLKGATLSDVRLEVTGRDMALRYPPGMRTRLDADLVFTGRVGAFGLSGNVKAVRGLYDLDVAFEESFREQVRRTEESALLRSVALDVRVETENPVAVRNNLAQLLATGNLVVRGDMGSPAPIGTLDIQPGGKVFIQGMDFVIRSGRLAYSGTWDPALSIEAQRSIEGTGEFAEKVAYTVTVRLIGTLERPGLGLRSEPALSEAEIVSLLATGRTRSGDPAARMVVGGQAAALLAGRLTRGLRGFGLDEVSIQPELVAREEAQTGARFTFGKRLSGNVDLVYSLSLQDPERRFIELKVRPGPGLDLSVRRQDEGTFRYGVGQTFRIGGPSRPRGQSADERVRIQEVRLEGDRPLEPGQLRSLLRTEAGQKRTIWDLQDAAERLREKLIERGYLEAESSARLEGNVAVFQIRSGARYRWRVEGMKDPPRLDDVIRQSLFEEEALDRGRQHLLGELRRRGHLRAEVLARGLDEGGSRTLLYTVEPGPVLDVITVLFPGASVFPRSQLLRIAGGPGRIVSDPEGARRVVLEAYQERHYLTAEVDPPRIEERDGRVRLEMPVREGRRARVASVRFEGGTRPETELLGIADVAPGSPYDAVRIRAALERLQDHYLSLGYPTIRLSADVVPRGPDLELVFDLREGEPVTVGSVVVEGLRRTSAALVRRRLRLRPGDPLDPRKLADAERRLLDLGVFSRVVASASPDNPATVTITVVEGERAVASYLASYDDKKRWTGQVDGEGRNVFGVGLSLGGRYLVGRDVRESRGSVHTPALGPLGDLTLSAFRLEEDLLANTLETERVQKGVQLQAAVELPGRWNLLYGYRFKRTAIFPTFPEPIDIAALDASLIRDTRDSVLDARRGRFLSLSLEYSPAFLASDFTFAKLSAQGFVSRALGASLTWAQGYRLGLAHGFGGQRLISTERFRAGGGNSLRGFETDTVGPRGVLGDPAGGQAVVVLNQELRYHHRSGLGAAVFYDAGNVFSTVRKLSLDLRHDLGAGLRWDSPVGLLRLDVGFPLDRLPDEKRYRFFLTLGQAF